MGRIWLAEYGENADVVHAIEAHHNEVEVRSQSKRFSFRRPTRSAESAGSSTGEHRGIRSAFERLEEIAAAREGVDKVFAMQAGREIRVMVAPTWSDDIEAQVLARDIAKQIEEELTYPGQIKVTVVRESRATRDALVRSSRRVAQPAARYQRRTHHRLQRAGLLRPASRACSSRSR